MARLFDSRDSDSASNAPKTTYTNLLNNPDGNVIDISHLDHKEYRFLDCHALLEDDQFRLVSFGTLSTLRYAAVSYLWRGTPPSVRNDSTCFTVAGAESLPPVNIHVLRLACKLANRLGADYLWLDCICIIQAIQEDKIWQIRRMSEIYSNCRLCIVLPVGLQRLVRFRWGEATLWTARSWTMQESVLPPDVYFLVGWGRLGPGKINGQLSIETLDDTTAYFTLKDLIYLQVDRNGEKFSDAKGSPEISLPGGMHGPCDRILNGPGYRRLMCNAMSKNCDDHDNAIWQSIVFRRCLKPVDAVLSHMSLLNIQLPTNIISKAILGPASRLAATIKLAQSYLEGGGKAHWLSFFLLMNRREPIYDDAGRRWDPSIELTPRFDRRMCTMICMSEEDDAGDDNFRTAGGARNGYIPQYTLIEIPGGSMDNQGYLIITVPSCLAPVRGVLSECRVREPRDVPVWMIDMGRMSDPNYQEQRLLISLRPHGLRKWHIIYVMFAADSQCEQMQWADQKFSIGGPHPMEGLFD